MEILFGVMFWTVVTVLVGKAAAVDVISSWRGEIPPRQRIRLARIERGETSLAPASVGYGGREWFDDLMEDTLMGMTRSRRQWLADRAAKKAAEREKKRRQEADSGQPLDDLAEAVREEPARRRPSPRPRPEPEPEPEDVPIPAAPKLATEPDIDLPTEPIVFDWEPRHHTHCSRCNTVSHTPDMPMVCPSCGADDSRLSEAVEPDGGWNPAPQSEAPAAAVGKEPAADEQTPAPAEQPKNSDNEPSTTDPAAVDKQPDPPAEPAPRQHNAPVIPLFPTTNTGDFDPAATRSYVLDAAAANGRCTYPVKGREYGICRSPVNDQPNHGGWPGNPHCPYHTALTKADTQPDNYHVIDINPNEENTMQSGETTHIQATRTFFTELGGHVNDEILPRLEQCSAVLAGKGMDPTVLAEIGNAREQFRSAIAALDTALEKHDALNRLMEEAVNNTEHAAETDYYAHR